MVLSIGRVEALAFTGENSAMSVIRPAPAPTGAPTGAEPQPLALGISAPRTYGLDQPVALQNCPTLPIPLTSLSAGAPREGACITATASLWPLPGPLLARARAGVATPYDVVLEDRRGDTASPGHILEGVTWGTVLSFRLRRHGASACQYELLGADAADRDLMLDLWRYLQRPCAPGTSAVLFLPCTPGAGCASGLVALAADPKLTFLVKTLAPAEPASPDAAGRPHDASPPAACHASFEELASWLRLLWEGSTMGGQGWHFSVTDSDGGGLPATALDAHGCVTLTLLVIAGEQQASPLAAGRTLLPFNNAAVVGPGLDVTAYRLCVEAADNSDDVRIARVAPGNVGFSVWLPPPGDRTAQAQLQALFSDATCRLVAAPFEAPAAAMPVGVAHCDGLGLDGRRRARNDRWRRAGRAVAQESCTGPWRYDQVIPVARFGPPSPAPAVPGLPDPGLDPYRGVGCAAVMQLEFADRHGDAGVGALPTGGTLTVPVGYTDPLIGVAQWPAVAAGFTLQPSQGGAQLQITVAAQLSMLQPQPGQTHDQFTGGVRQLAERYASIHFQLAQPRLSLSVMTSLQQDGSGARVPIALDGLAALRAFAASGYVAARAAASLLPGPRTGSTAQLPAALSLPGDAVQVRVPYTLRAGDSLASVAAIFEHAPGGGSAALQLATANLAMPGTVVGGTVEVAGVQVQAQAGDSLANVLARLQARSSAITLADLVQAIGATSGHLAPGGLLVCPPALLPGSVTLTPAQAAATYGLDAVSFAQANAGLLGLVASGVVLRLPHDDRSKGSVTTCDEDTFNSLVSRFAARGVQTSLAGMLKGLQDCAFIRAGARALLPPAPVLLSTASAVGTGPFSAAAFELDVTVRLQRPGDAVDPGLRTALHDGPVERAESVIPAAISVQGQRATLTEAAFSEQLRACLPSLRLATGKDVNADTEPWVVDFGAGGIATLEVAPGVKSPDESAVWPRVFAQRPLYQAAVTLAVEIHSLLENGALSPGASTVSFSAADVEAWARRFLADVDLFLSPPCVDGVYRNEAARQTLDTVLAAKAVLAGSIADGLTPVLKLKDACPAGGLTEARSVLAQALRLRLAPAYAVSLALQYDTTVQSPWMSPGQLGARLHGTARPAAGQAYTPMSASSRLDESPSFTTLLVTMNETIWDSRIQVDLPYECSELELEIQEEQGPAGCESSRWIRFAPPLKSDLLPDGARVALGSAEVPLARRAYPALPTLHVQTATRDFASPATPDEAIRWSYQLSYTCEHAAQDEVFVEVCFNVTSAADQFRPGQAEGFDLASALARYMWVADGLRDQLDCPAYPSACRDATRQARAAHTFATLVTDVKDAWGEHWKRPWSATTGVLSRRQEELRQDLSYRLQFTSEGCDLPSGPCALVLTRVEAPKALDVWPEVCIEQPDGKSVQLIADVAVGDARIYNFPTAYELPEVALTRLSLTWAGLSVVDQQNACASLWVQRNRTLLGTKGPGTNDEFVYRTPPVRMPGIVTPLNISDAPVDITKSGDTLAKALATAFAAIASVQQDAPPRSMTLAARHEHQVAPASATLQGAYIALPVFLAAECPLSEASAVAVAAALDTWQSQNQPASSNARWAFSLTLYSTVDRATNRPLLQLDMVYDIKA